jgi:hypothetical protein
MGREQDEKEGIGSAGRIVNPKFLIQAEPGVDMPYHFGGIAAVQIGTCKITNIRFRYPWNASSSQYNVTSVPAGESFALVVDYSAQNTVGGTTDMWALCIVWYDITGDSTLDGYWTRTCDSTVADGVDARITGPNGFLIMPSHNVNLNFNMFINDDHNVTTPPDRSAWANLRS